MLFVMSFTLFLDNILRGEGTGGEKGGKGRKQGKGREGDGRGVDIGVFSFQIFPMLNLEVFALPAISLHFQLVCK